MPSTGGTPFLQDLSTAMYVQNTKGCQCPQRAGHHFYTGMNSSSPMMMSLCQCPQRAGHHFYNTMTNNQDTVMEKCQCPQRAGHHFYPVSECGEVYAKDVVSMPSTGGTPFLQRLQRKQCIFCGGVNALNGRDTISTPLL